MYVNLILTQEKLPLQVENSQIIETFTIHKHEISEYNPSTLILGLVALIFVLSETFGNFLLYCTILYEKFGMDSQKRTVTNQLLSSICWNQIVFNCVFLTLKIIDTFGLQSKTISCFHLTNIHNKEYSFIPR